MINKKVDNVQVALEGLENGMTIMLGGFGLCGIPENSIAELVKKETTDLTCISNNAGVDDFGLGLLCTKTNQKMISPMLEKMLNLNAAF
jgi:3-oxoacid CoA-transferase subunit A